MSGIVTAIFGGLRASAKHAGGHPRDPALAQLFPVQNTHSGQVVTELTAMQSSAVHACVRVIAETLAGLPLILYKRTENGKERATDDPLYSLLHDQPNPWQTSYEFREMLMGHMLLTGNGYAEIVRSGDGIVRLLRPLHPQRVRPFRYRDNIAYAYTEQDGTQRILFKAEMLHVRNMVGSDGVTGMSMIALARESIGLSLATEEHGARLFSNDATPAGILEHPGTLDDAAIKRLRESWENTHRGSGNAHKTAILEGGLQYKQISINPKDSQFIEARRFQIADIARVYRVPLHLIGDLEKSAFSNIEQQGLDFVVHTMRPWLIRWEQAIRRDLFTAAEKQVLFAEFLVDGLLRGDISSRYAAYGMAIKDGHMSRNEVREIEGRNTVPGLDEFLIPLNMAEVGDTDDGDADEDDGTDTVEDAQARLAVLLQAAEARIERKEAALIEKHGVQALQDDRHVAFVAEVLAISEDEARANIAARQEAMT